MKIGILGAGSVARAIGELARIAGHEPLCSERAPKDSSVSFQEASQLGELILIAVPYTAVSELLPPLSGLLDGKTVIDATNPLNEDWSPKFLGANTSGAEEIAKSLPGTDIVKAFNTSFADIMKTERLTRLGVPVTAFIAGDNSDARRHVGAFAESLSFAPIETGPLMTARYLEAMAHLNIAIAVGQSGGTDAAFIYDQGAA